MDGCLGGVKYRATNNGAINKWLLNYIQKETLFLVETKSIGSKPLA